MTAPDRVLVIDIGKTNAKAALVEAGSFAEVDVVTRPNEVLPGPTLSPLRHRGPLGLHPGVGAHAQRPARAQAVAVTTHGASAVLVDAGGGLALPALDYEHDGPDECAADYDAARPGFEETGTPRLPKGLVLGAQIFWQFRRFPEAAARTASILTYPQYWSFRLTGVRASEATSLGTHTDLWVPDGGDSRPWCWNRAGSR